MTNPENKAKSSAKRKRGNPDKIVPFQWKPGHSGNPGGRPKRDAAAEIAVAVFEGNAELIYEAMTKAMIEKGDARVFAALADRAYGKAAQSIKIEGHIEQDPSGRLAELFAKAANRAKPEPESGRTS